LFGGQSPLRGSFLLITGHFGEHVGQSIADARISGAVPPWTGEQQRQQKTSRETKIVVVGAKFRGPASARGAYYC